MCNNEVVLVEGEKFSCCGGMADWEEDVNARVMVPVGTALAGRVLVGQLVASAAVHMLKGLPHLGNDMCCCTAPPVQAQVIRVAQLSTVAATQGTTLGIRQLSVHLWDDLCGRVHVGNRVLVVGAGTLLLPPAVRGVAAPRMLASTQFVASNLMVLNPAPVLINPHEHSPEARQYLQGMAGGELEAVLVCMRTWQRGLPCCQLLHVALLLSAAASGAKRVQLGEEAAPEDEEDQSEPEGFLPNSPGSRSRQQVGRALDLLCAHESLYSFQLSHTLLPQLLLSHRSMCYASARDQTHKCTPCSTTSPPTCASRAWRPGPPMPRSCCRGWIRSMSSLPCS